MMKQIAPTPLQRQGMEQMEQRLDALLHDPIMPVPGYGVMAFDRGGLVYQRYGGLARIEPGAPGGGTPFGEDTRFRTASISKIFSALAVMQLCEEGKIDLDEDAGLYLDFPLRNPNYPAVPITLRMLLSHTSSVRDGSVYSIPPEDRLEELLLPGGKYNRFGDHFADGSDGTDRSPGRYFSYANLNYGIIGTILERLSGIRFDEYMRTRVLEPMGLGASFNVGDFDVQALGRLSPIYQSRNGALWDASQPWAAQIDDYNGREQPRNRVLITNPDLGGENVMASLADYRIGDNGTLFSPQGGLRISCREMRALAELLLTGGLVDGKRLLSEQSVDTLFTPCWRYDPDHPNGDSYDGLMCCYGPGIHTMTSGARDRFLQERDIVLSGHFGEAYGLLAGLFLDRARGRGIFYVINGQGAPDSEHHGRYSGMYEWEERLCTALLDCFFPKG